MECLRCKASVAAGSKFCEQCGEPLPQACPACGHGNSSQAKFCAECGTALSARQSVRPDPRPRAVAPAVIAERRQVTIMFCDMVGSSALSTRLDPEEQREVVSTFQSCCAGEIKRLGGLVAQYLGDGVLAYFGHPAAHEDDAERAVRAGLAILDAVAALRSAAGDPVQTRIGIASGVVVVGDLVREGVTQENAAIGETTNLAARLQAVADPDALLICPETHRLVGALFEYRDLGPQRLKGFAHAVHVRQVVEASTVENRFEARQAGIGSPLLGRDEELELLLRRWEEAKGGKGRVVLLAGEAGIGKSRLIRALLDRLAGERFTPLIYHCSPYHQESALYPVISQLLRAAAIGREDAPETKIDKLEALLELSSESLADDMPLFATLLSLPGGERYPIRKLSPQHLKELTLGALLRQLKGLAARRPVLMIFEDLHWVDPTTLELLSLTVEQMPEARALFLATSRPEFAAPWPSHRHTSIMSLNRLGRAEGRALVEGVTGGKALPPEVLEQILTRTDGVPLFIEELTKTVLETGLLREVGARYELTGLLPPMAIPSTLHASLLARLDRLASVKDLAQIGAVIGREFPYRLIAAVAVLPDKDLRGALAQLVKAELIFQRGTPPDATYLFKHALVQHAAHESLVRSRRQQLHGLVAQALEREFPGIVETEPEVVAHHYTEARMVAPAIGYWKKAGNRALERSANSEAIDHLKRALALVQDIGDAAVQLREECACRYALGKATVAAGHLVEATHVFAAAMALARELHDSEHVALCALGFDQAQFLAGPSEKSIEVLRDAMKGLADDDSNLRCQIVSRLGRAYRMRGDVGKATAMDREAIQLARRLGDDRALFDALTGWVLSALPVNRHEFNERAGQVEELIETARRVDDPDYLGRALSTDIYHAAEVGDRARLDRAIAVYKQYSDKHHGLLMQWISRSSEAMRAILDGNFERAEALCEQARAVGTATQAESIEGVFGMQMFSIRREQGRLAEVAPIVKRFMEDDPGQSMWQPGFALIASDLGYLDAARRRLADLAEQGFSMPFDAKRSTSLSYLAEVAATVNDEESARRLYEMLLDYQHMTITTGIVTVCHGSAGRYLGMLAAVLGDHETATEHFEQALAMDADLGARPWLAHTQVEYARLLLRHGNQQSIKLAEELTSAARATAADLNMVRLQKRLQASAH